MSRITDGRINELTLKHLGQWPSFEAQSWACKVAALTLRAPEVLDVSIIPEGWFLWGLYHQHSRIIYEGQVHEPFSQERNGQEPWCANIQHVKGGRMKQGTGATPREAVLDAILGVHEWEHDNEHRPA